MVFEPFVEDFDEVFVIFIIWTYTWITFDEVHDDRSPCRVIGSAGT